MANEPEWDASFEQRCPQEFGDRRCELRAGHEGDCSLFGGKIRFRWDEKAEPVVNVTSS